MKLALTEKCSADSGVS